MVEDEDRSARDAIESMEHTLSEFTVVRARSRDEALAALEGAPFDLILCDIRLPPHVSSADVQESHGLSIHAAARAMFPGTPLIFLTGFSTSRETRTQLAYGGVATLFGITGQPLVDLIDKDDPEGLETRLAKLNEGWMLIHSVTVTGLTAEHSVFRRAVGQYAVGVGHDRADVTLASGLSGAHVGRVRLTSATEAPAAIFLKTTGHVALADEFDRYRKYVSNRLSPGYFAPTQEPITAGLGGESALVSTLADGCSSLFGFVSENPDSGPDVVDRLRDGLRPWTGSPGMGRRQTLGDLRRLRLPDSYLGQCEAALQLAEFADNLEVPMREVICHGDLHGENVLVDPDGRPMLIDFGDTGPGIAPLDPITLELSLLFHSSGPARNLPQEADLRWEEWADVTSFAGDSPYAPFVRATRRWAREIATDDEIMACAYAHSLRQIKYKDVDNASAVAVARSAVQQLHG